MRAVEKIKKGKRGKIKNLRPFRYMLPFSVLAALRQRFSALYDKYY